MSSSDRYERRLPTLLEELSAPRTPDYFDDILGRVGRTRQRPGWTFPERWLPMSAVSERLAAAPRAPVRAMIFVALLVLAVVAAIAIIAGSQQHRVPAPFGPAEDGIIAFADDSGAIQAGLLADGAFKVIVPGPGNDRPVFSPDGTKLAYLHVGGPGDVLVMVASPDGSKPRTLNSAGLASIEYLGWTPDSGSVVVAVTLGPLLTFDAAKESEPSVLSDKVVINGSSSGLGRFGDGAANLFRAPLGEEFAYVGTGPEGVGLYAARRDGASLRPLLTPRTGGLPFVSLDSPQWSPDGSRIAVSVLQPGAPEYATHVYLMNADGTNIRRLNSGCPDVETSENFAAWSPDGTKIALMRWCQHSAADPNPRPITIVDVATGADRELADVEANGMIGWGWSPDGKSIIEVAGPPVADGNVLRVVDATTGAVTRTTGITGSAPTWQRNAPIR